MDIMFEIVSRQKFSAAFPIFHVFGEAGGYIGRSDDCEWVLPDRSRQISRQHALVTFEDGHFFLEDISSNGVFLSLGHEGIGKNNRHRIEHGEGFIIGEYTIMTRLLHDPGTYAPSGVPGQEVAAFAARLSLDPLTAMEQEEENNVRDRVGEAESLLRPRHVPAPRPSDHNDPRISRLQPIVAVDAREEIIPENWDADPDSDYDEISAPTSGFSAEPHAEKTTPVHLAEATPAHLDEVTPTPKEPACLVPEMDTRHTEEFFRLLGFPVPPADAEERRRILHLTAQLLAASVDGMSHALRNRAVCKGELRLPATSTGLGVNNNPLKFSPTSEAALACLLGPPQKGVLSPLAAVHEGFNDLHSHHMGLLAGARAATSALLEKLSPSAVEARLDMDEPVRFGRMRRLWNTFKRMHQALRDDQRDFAGLMLHDFARAYEMQGRTLNPQETPTVKGDHR